MSYSVVDRWIGVRTSPYSELGSCASDSPAAFEVDRIDEETRSGWSVVAAGRLRRVTDSGEIERIRRDADPEPWAAGSRALYLCLDWRELSGRRLEGGDRRDAGLGTVVFDHPAGSGTRMQWRVPLTLGTAGGSAGDQWR